MARKSATYKFETITKNAQGIKSDCHSIKFQNKGNTNAYLIADGTRNLIKPNGTEGFNLNDPDCDVA